VPPPGHDMDQDRFLRSAKSRAIGEPDLTTPASFRSADAMMTRIIPLRELAKTRGLTEAAL
jgi:hypothetical protein